MKTTREEVLRVLGKMVAAIASESQEAITREAMSDAMTLCAHVLADIDAEEAALPTPADFPQEDAV